jgi:hypothetical protein
MGTQATRALAAPERARLVVAADRVVRGRVVKAGGCGSPHLTVVRDASVPVASAIVAWAVTLGGLAPAQIYSGTSSGPASNRTFYDGAIGRTDHASFHEQGYPAVVVSEDFFVNDPAEPLEDSHPNYHDEDDLVIDTVYAEDITCAIAYAVKELAGG